MFKFGAALVLSVATANEIVQQIPSVEIELRESSVSDWSSRYEQAYEPIVQGWEQLIDDASSAYGPFKETVDDLIRQEVEVAE